MLPLAMRSKTRPPPIARSPLKIQSVIRVIGWLSRSVVVAGWEITDVQGDSAESLDLHRLPLLEKPIGDAALI
ncbi:MAG TPA: hypothetical protein VEH31_03720, partial [Streptosporangiaceae bacterium]|nr:hypothetical protein [Streptosporangiaceae bacterium]